MEKKLTLISMMVIFMLVFSMIGAKSQDEEKDSSGSDEIGEKSAQEAGEISVVDLGNGIKLEMAWMPAGTLIMGDESLSRVNPPKKISVDGFWMGKYEVTQEQFQAIMGTNPSIRKGEENPVSKVSWIDAMEFCTKLSKQTGQNFILPTEAQWQYSCRAGTTTAYYFGDDSGPIGDYAWWNGNSNQATHPVGEKQPNNWGLYDMNGNVWEWCLSVWEPYPYSETDGRNSLSDRTMGRVMRGGSYDSADPNIFRCSFRNLSSPSYQSYNIGFRCARTLLAANEVSPDLGGEAGNQSDEKAAPGPGESAGSVDQPLFPVKVNSKWGYIDKTGGIVIDPQFDEADKFSEGLALVKVGGLMTGRRGYIDKTGTIVIKLQYEFADSFSDGLAAVQAKVGDSWGYINKEGTMIISPQFVFPMPFREGLANMMVGADFKTSKWGYIDKSGKMVISPQYRPAQIFSEGLAAVLDIKAGMYGFIDKTGTMVILPQFGYGFPFHEGLSFVHTGDAKSGKWGCIDKTGTMVIDPQFDDAHTFSEGLAEVMIGDKETGKWGYIDNTGKYVISLKYDFAGSFSEGRAAVKIGDKYGYIDKTGKSVIKPRFDGADSFTDGLARVEIEGKYGYIDKTGKYVWEPSS